MQKLVNFNESAVLGTARFAATFISICIICLSFAFAPGAGAREDEALPNFHEVHPFLFRGGEPSEEGLMKLKERGITTVIDLRAFGKEAKKEKAKAQELGMKYINLPMDWHAPTKKQVETFLNEVDLAKTKRANDGSEKGGPVFVHCAHGSDRTGCMVGVWRVARDGWNYDDAYKEMRKYYFGPKYTQLSGTVKNAGKYKKKEVVSNPQ